MMGLCVWIGFAAAENYTFAQSGHKIPLDTLKKRLFSTQEQAAQLYFDQHSRLKTSNGYEALLQSPTISNSAMNPCKIDFSKFLPSFSVSDFVMPRHNAYVPNGDSLAALLSHSMADDPLLNRSGLMNGINGMPTAFPPASTVYSAYVKPEPCDPYISSTDTPVTSEAYLIQQQNYLNGFCNPTAVSYADMMPMVPSTIAGNLLPVCPIPTEKTIDTVFYSGVPPSNLEALSTRSNLEQKCAKSSTNQ